MKKRIFILLILLIGVFLISSTALVAVNAAEGTEETEVVEDDTETTDVTLADAKAELKAWWNDSMLPWILTAIAGFSGSGLVALVLGFIIKKLKKELNDTIADASTALGLSNEANAKITTATDNLTSRVEDLFNNRLSTFETAMSRIIDEKLDEKLKTFQISAEEVAESRERLKVVAESIMKSMDENKENGDENKN